MPRPAARGSVPAVVALRAINSLFMEFAGISATRLCTNRETGRGKWFTIIFEPTPNIIN